MPVWLSAMLGVILLIAAIQCRRNERLRSYSTPAFLSAGFFLAYSLLVLFLMYH